MSSSRPFVPMSSVVSGCVLAAALAGCSHKLSSDTKPTVVEETKTYCNGDQTFVVHGTGLSPMVVDGATDKPKVRMPRVCLAPSDGSGQAKCLDDKDVSWVSQTELHFTLHAGGQITPTAGDYDVTITNPDGKEAKGKVHIHVLPGEVLLFWSDPSVVYNGISTQITLYGSNIGGVQSVSLRDHDTPEADGTALAFTQDATTTNRVQVIVPSQTPQTDDPSKSYDVVVKTDSCEATLFGFEVTDQTTLQVDSIDPTFGWTDEPTSVTILGAGFAPVPRAYLNPTVPTTDTVSSALSSLAFNGANNLTAVVPAGLPADAYSLIVVNPDLKVGLLGDAANPAFVVTSGAPVVVNNVSPNYVDNGSAQTVTIEGANFDTPTVDLTCRAPGSTTDQKLTGTVAAGVTPTSFDVSLPVATLTDGTVCVVRVTNADGSYFDYSAIGISLPSSNLNDFLTSPALITARRAPAVASGRATAAARFLYAVGGDNGAPASALTSVETSPIDVYGVPGAWFEQPVPLPAKRTLAGIARVGLQPQPGQKALHYLYLVGGNDGTGPTASVLRAQVLDPLAAPKITDVAARRGVNATEGLAAGVWYYRVSAVMADTDNSNPGGETLASDPLTISLSSELASTVVPTLIWDAVPGAKSYRVYRNPNGTPDETLDSVRLLGEVTDPNYTDVSGTPAGASPLPLGATGVWAPMPNLGTPREAAGVAAAADPGDPNKWYVYALGGRSTAALATWERLDVTIDPATGEQTVGTAWVAGAQNLPGGARAELTAYSVSHSQAKQIPAGTTFIYAGSGKATGMVSSVDVAQVGAGGALLTPGATTAGWLALNGPQRAGYAGIAGAGFLFAFGGDQGAPSNSNSSVQIDPTAFPDYSGGWNNEGVRLLQPRYLAGSVEESAFIYVVGGATDTGPTDTVERTVL